RPEELGLVQREWLDQLQHLQHGKALRRRRSLVQREVAIGAGDRLAPTRVLTRKIRFGEKTAAIARELRELARRIAFVEARPATRTDHFERVRKTGVAQCG